MVIPFRELFTEHTRQARPVNIPFLSKVITGVRQIPMKYLLPWIMVMEKKKACQGSQT